MDRVDVVRELAGNKPIDDTQDVFSIHAFLSPVALLLSTPCYAAESSLALGLPGSAWSIGCLLVVAIAVVLATVAWRKVNGSNRRVAGLAVATAAIVNGNLDQEIDEAGGDSIAILAAEIKRLQSMVHELDRSRENLQQFAYAASHDMKSPIRAIENLAQWTLEDAGDVLPEDCKHNLNTLLGRARRLSTLQDDILAYAMAGNAEEDPQPLQLHDMLSDIVEQLDAHNQHRLSLSSEPDGVHTYTNPLRQVLHCLISNAIKHDDREAGVIDVSAVVAGSRMTVSISDNGPGIAQEFHDKVFEMFQTLQSQDVIEGSGLGLSIARKLVERYGGELLLRSNEAVGRGCVFEFDWPVVSQP